MLHVAERALGGDWTTVHNRIVQDPEDSTKFTFRAMRIGRDGVSLAKVVSGAVDERSAELWSGSTTGEKVALAPVLGLVRGLLLSDRVVEAGRSVLGLPTGPQDALDKFRGADVQVLYVEESVIDDLSWLFRKTSVREIHFRNCRFIGSEFDMSFPSHLERVTIIDPMGGELSFSYENAKALKSLRVFTGSKRGSISRDQIGLNAKSIASFPEGLEKCEIDGSSLVPFATSGTQGDLWGVTIGPEPAFPDGLLALTNVTHMTVDGVTIYRLDPFYAAKLLAHLVFQNNTFKGTGLVVEPPSESKIQALEFRRNRGELSFRLGDSGGLVSLAISDHTPALTASCVKVFGPKMRTFTIDGANALPYVETKEEARLQGASVPPAPAFPAHLLAATSLSKLVIDGVPIEDMAPLFASRSVEVIEVGNCTFVGGPLPVSDTNQVQSLWFHGNTGTLQFRLGHSSLLKALTIRDNKDTIDDSWFVDLPPSLGTFWVHSANAIGHNTLGLLEVNRPGGVTGTLKVDRGHRLDLGRVLREFAGWWVELAERSGRTLFNRQEGIRTHVRHQPEAVSSVCQVLGRALAPRASNAPRLSLFLAGPPGVGKSHTGFAIAEAIGTSTMIHLPLSVCGDAQGLERELLAVRKNGKTAVLDKLRKANRGGKPYVFLLDEFENAHLSAKRALMQMLRTGEITIQGKKESFSNAIVVMTSNLAADTIVDLEDYDAARRAARDALVDNVYPGAAAGGAASVGAIDRIVPYRALSVEHVREILELRGGALIDKLGETHSKNIAIEDGVYDAVMRAHHEAGRGARRVVKELGRAMKAAIAEADGRGIASGDKSIGIWWDDSEGAIMAEGSQDQNYQFVDDQCSTR